MTLLVAGSLHLDVVMRAPHLPQLDETVTGQSVDYVFGGKGGNQAVAARRMGAGVRFVGRAGSDRFGDMLRETLGNSGIDLTGLQCDDGASGMSTAIIDANGDYGAVIVSAANLNIDAGAVQISPDVRLVLLQNEVPDSVNLEVARKAKEAGARVWLNAAPARELPRDLVALLDLVIVNRVEAAFYGQAIGDVPVLMTLGAEGVTYVGCTFPAYPVPVHSTHGAGDMFVGALAARVADGAEILEALPFAQAAAALHVAANDTQRQALNEARVHAFVRRHSSHARR